VIGGHSCRDTEKPLRHCSSCCNPIIEFWEKIWFLNVLNGLLEFYWCECSYSFVSQITLSLQIIYLDGIMALNAVPISLNIRPICLFEILDAEVGNAFVRDWRSSWKYLIDFVDSFATKIFWALITFSCLHSDNHHCFLIHIFSKGFIFSNGLVHYFINFV
jgi:hypothetical protein